MAKAVDPWLNSFIPNLVWVPKPLDVYSDRDGHVVQTLLRQRSVDLFGNAPAFPGQWVPRVPGTSRTAAASSQRVSEHVRRIRLLGNKKDGKGSRDGFASRLVLDRSDFAAEVRPLPL